jgi:hypothetical protein
MRSAFDYYTISGVVCVEDRNEAGKMSVTNDADAVVKFVLQTYPKAKTIIYRDSEGKWDQLLFVGGEFTAFRYLGTKDRQEAINVASKVDVSKYPLTTEGDYLIEDFRSGKGYWNAKEKKEIRSIGRSLIKSNLTLQDGRSVETDENTYLASHTVKFYSDPNWECVWLS